MKAKCMFDMMARYISPHHVQVHRNITLCGKATTTTATVRALKLSAINDVVQYRLIYPKRSKPESWIEWNYMVEAFKKRIER